MPWNNKNTEFEGRQQNMMGYSCMKAVVYEHTPKGKFKRNIHNMLLQKLSEANEYIDLLDLNMS